MKINDIKRSVTHNYLGEFRQQMIDRGREVKEVVTVTDQTVLGGSEAVGTVKQSSRHFNQCSFFLIRKCDI